MTTITMCGHYCLACGHYLPLSGETLRCADCDETWCRDYRAKGDRHGS